MEYAALRFLHLLAGILWAGGGVTLGWFVIPAALDAGPHGGLVLRELVVRRFPAMMTAAGLVTVLTGVRLYMLRYGPGWLGTMEGIAITLGALLGIGALAIAAMSQRPNTAKLAAAYAAIGQGPATAAQQAEIDALTARQRKLGSVVAWHLLSASLLMAGRAWMVAS